MAADGVFITYRTLVKLYSMYDSFLQSKTYKLYKTSNRWPTKVFELNKPKRTITNYKQ